MRWRVSLCALRVCMCVCVCACACGRGSRVYIVRAYMRRPSDSVLARGSAVRERLRLRMCVVLVFVSVFLCVRTCVFLPSCSQ